MLFRRGPWIARALEGFQKAVALNPAYAQAWAGVADEHHPGLLRLPSSTETMPSAAGCHTRTVIHPGSAEAHNALAVAALLQERDFSKAEREFRKALTLNPRYTQARCWYGLFFLQWGVGRDQDGLAKLACLRERSPLRVRDDGAVIGARDGETVRRSRGQAQNAVQHDPESFSRSGNSRAPIAGKASMKGRSPFSSRCGPPLATTG